MLVEKTLAALAAAVAIAAAAAVSVVAAAFALYAVLFPHLGAAGAAATLAVVFAVAALVGGLIAARVAEGPRRRHSHHQESPPVTDSLLAKAFDLAKEKPLIAAGAAVAAGIFVIRNPAVLSALVGAFLAGSSSPPPPKR